MHVEENRLSTFHNWPINSAVSPSRIARGGFFYTGTDEIVKCFSCNITISEWNYGDQVMTLHRLANPECSFVLDPTSTNNVPLLSEPTARRSLSTDDNSNRNLKRYSERLSTFENWPISSIVSPERLARSGLYYLQREDMVACIYCNSIIYKWEPGDDPDEEHRKHNPHCDFFWRAKKDEDLSSELLDLENVKLMPGMTSNLTELGIQQHSGPRQPKHASYDGRLLTFDGWPKHLKQTPGMLADAGFFYMGTHDQVRCFHCDGSLRNWEETDDAWIEHAKWFPKCGYVSLIKGPEFIKQCEKNRPPLDPSILSLPATPQTSSTNVPAQSVVRRVTDAELDGLLGSAPAVAALEIGLQVGRVKMALKRQMELTGLPYANADQLIEDANQIQLEEDDNILNNQRIESSDIIQWMFEMIPNQAQTSQMNSGSSSSSSGNNAQVNEINDEENSTPEQSSTSSTKEASSTKPPSESLVKENKKENKVDKTAALEEENQRLKEARLCKVCIDQEVAVVFLPCSHLSTCLFCAPSLTNCPICRQEIRATVRTFLA